MRRNPAPPVGERSAFLRRSRTVTSTRSDLRAGPTYFAAANGALALPGNATSRVLLALVMPISRSRLVASPLPQAYDACLRLPQGSPCARLRFLPLLSASPPAQRAFPPRR